MCLDFFFFQAEDGIRDGHVTGVQTCALPISYGLISYVFTRDLDRAIRVSEALETGMVGLNQGVISNPAAPFGGIKESGLGREGGFSGIDEFLETKYVGIKA